MQDYALRRRRFKGVFGLLPPLRQLDRVGAQLLVAGVLLLTGGVVAGIAMPAAAGTGARLNVAAGVFICAAYAGLLFFRKRNRVRGPLFAKISVLLFIVALLVLWPAHATLSPS